MKTKDIIIIIAIIIAILLIIFLILKNRKSEIKEIKGMKELEYVLHDGRNMFGTIKYKIECNDKCILKTKLSGYTDEEYTEVEIDKEQMNKILEILKRYNVKKWDGFNKADKHVLDGKNFEFILITDDNKKIRAEGYMKYPNGFKDCINELKKVFNDINSKIYINLLEDDYYKGLKLEDITKIIKERYTEGGLTSEDITDQNEINNKYDYFNKLVLTKESNRACEDNTTRYRIITKNKEYIVEEECDNIVLNNKRYHNKYKEE